MLAELMHRCGRLPRQRADSAPWLQIGYRSALTSPVTYTNVVTGANIGQRTSTSTPYVHFGYWRNGCTPSSSAQCCVYAEQRGRYDYW
jgi:hypothetical protein